MVTKEAVSETRNRLIEAGGRTSQDLGAGRLVGMVLVYLYLQEEECSLDAIGEDLELSKASVSIAARQLEQLGLVRRIWKKGERKKYYRSAKNIAQAIQKGMLAVVQQKISLFGEELDRAKTVLDNSERDSEVAFLQQRIARASSLQKSLKLLLNNPLMNYLSKESEEKNKETSP